MKFFSLLLEILYSISIALVLNNYTVTAHDGNEGENKCVGNSCGLLKGLCHTDRQIGLWVFGV